MIKILQILSSLSRNGTEAFVMNSFRNFDQTKFHFDFLVFTESTDGYYEEVLNAGSKIYRLPARSSSPFTYLQQLDLFFKQYAKEYSVIHHHSCTLTSVAPIYYAKKYNIPIRVVHSHNSKNAKGIHNYVLHHINKLRISTLATHFLGCSDLALKWFYGSTKARHVARLINNGIDISKWKFNAQVRQDYRNQLGLEDCFVIGHVGRFTKVKNHHYLIDIFQEVLTQKSNARLVLVGEGEMYSSIVTLVKERGLAEYVKFLGVRSDVPYLLSMMDAFVLPSLFEGLPFALIEAQAAGLKVFTSNNVSKQVMVTSNIFSLSLDIGIKQWANCIIEKSYEYDRVDVSKAIVERGFSIQHTIQALEAIYSGKHK